MQLKTKAAWASPMMESFPECPGSYSFLIKLEAPHTITVGNLGTFALSSGYYVYSGSAKNGLANRLTRYFTRGQKKLHWHIDYLLAVAYPLGYYISTDRGECELNKMFAEKKGAKVVVEGFGCTDCSCKTHLIYFSRVPIL